MTTESKVVIVTGASQGIGAGLVRGFRAAGYRVVANSRSIAGQGPADDGIVTIGGDVGDPATGRALVAAALERFGRLDTLVNNAGIFISKPFTEYTAADYAAIVNVNLAGFFHVTQAVAPRLLDQGHGHIVTITTTLVDQPMAGVPSGLPALTKGGLDAATRSLAIEYATRGVRVNAVAPGIIRTPMHAPEALDFLATLQPTGKLGEVEDITQAVLYLDRAGFVTGETLHVDGGAHAGRW